MPTHIQPLESRTHLAASVSDGLLTITPDRRSNTIVVRAADTSTTTLNPAKGLPRRRIDYVFTSRDGKPSLRPLSAEIVFDRPAADGAWPSDHFGVVARFAVER